MSANVHESKFQYSTSVSQAYFCVCMCLCVTRWWWSSPLSIILTMALMFLPSITTTDTLRLIRKGQNGRRLKSDNGTYGHTRSRTPTSTSTHTSRRGRQRECSPGNNNHHHHTKNAPMFQGIDLWSRRSRFIGTHIQTNICIYSACQCWPLKIDGHLCHMYIFTHKPRKGRGGSWLRRIDSHWLLSPSFSFSPFSREREGVDLSSLATKIGDGLCGCICIHTHTQNNKNIYVYIF